MNKTGLVKARIDEKIKSEAELILNQLGLTTSEAIRLLMNQIVLRKGLPLELRIPNHNTLSAIQAGSTGRTYASAQELFDQVIGEAKTTDHTTVRSGSREGVEKR